MKIFFIKVLQIINDEIQHGILPERIILGGFSMGGAMAYFVALTSDFLFGGCFTWGSWMPLIDRFPRLLSKIPNKLSMPIFLCHGEKDSIVKDCHIFLVDIFS